MTTRSWTNPNGGNWTTNGDWSAPGFPGQGDTAFISAPGTYTVTINDFEQPQFTALADFNATLAIASTGTLTGALALHGTLSVAGTLLNAAVTNDGGTVVSAGGTLDGVTWIGPLVLDTPGGALSIRNGLTITDGMGHAGTISFSNGFLGFTDAKGLDGSVLDLGDKAELDQGASTAAIFLGPNELVRQLGSVGGVTFFGIVNNKGTIDLAGAAGSAATFAYAGHQNFGTIDVGERVTFQQSVTNAASGVIDVGQGGKLTLNAGTTTTILGGKVVVEQGGSLVSPGLLGGAGVIHLASGGVARLVDYAGTVQFDDAAGALKLQASTFSGTIKGFQNGDTLDFLGGGILSADWSNNVLSLHENGFTATVNLVGNYAGLNFTPVSDGGSGQLITVSCFRAGTLIETARGPVAIELLSVGEHVTTHDGTSLPIVWLGHRRINFSRHPHPEQARPFRVRAGAFGPDLPSRDLWLSPDHALLVEGALIPVKHLAEPGVIEQVAVASVDYWHVELERHAVVLAEGLPAESYLDTGQRADISDAEAVTTLHPTFSVRAWEADGCAPLVVAGPVVERTRAELHRRARVSAAA